MQPTWFISIRLIQRKVFQVHLFTYDIRQSADCRHFIPTVNHILSENVDAPHRYATHHNALERIPL